MAKARRSFLLQTRREVSKLRRMKMKRGLTVSEAGRRGARAQLRKYGRRQLRAWGKLGGRPKKSKAQ